MNLTPKKDFLEKKEWARMHADLVVHPNFREAVNASLIDMVLALPDTTSPTDAAANYHKIQGAKEFINRLLNIAEMNKSLPPSPTVNLDHKAR